MREATALRGRQAESVGRAAMDGGWSRVGSYRAVDVAATLELFAATRCGPLAERREHPRTTFPSYATESPAGGRVRPRGSPEPVLRHLPGIVLGGGGGTPEGEAWRSCAA